MSNIWEGMVVDLARKRARVVGPEGSALFYEASVIDIRSARDFVERIGFLPIESQGLVHVVEEDLWIHHSTLSELPDIRLWKGEVLGDEMDTIRLTYVGPLFPEKERADG